jgi:thioredoxin 1
MTGVSDLTAATVDAAVVRSQIVLVEFSAEWCAACLPMRAIIEEIALERSGSAEVAHVDVGLHPSVLERYGVQALPTSVVFVDGVEARRLTGACTKRRLLQFLDEVIVEVKSRPDQRNGEASNGATSPNASSPAASIST